MNSLALIPLFASSDVTVDFDPTLFAQFALFSLFVILLKPLLFDPLLRVFEERERRTEGAKREAREMDEEAGRLLVDYERELEQARRTASVERERLRAQTARLEAEIMTQARSEAAAVLESGRAQIARDVAQMRRDLERGRPALAAQIASRVLGREVAP